ncbi:hypothetical protein [Dokdonia sp.]|uniref:hypothetical protein n=1 Tax=Dokdonia sp. TaxID=2024995 RepID=UPI003264012B
MLHQYDLEICKISIYENYVINQIKEGIHLEVLHVESLSILINKHIKNRPFIYISNRINSYSFDPLVHDSINKIENLIALVIITNDKTKQGIVQFEKQFSNKTLMIYEHLDEAISWAKDFFDKKNIQ